MTAALRPVDPPPDDGTFVLDLDALTVLDVMDLEAELDTPLDVIMGALNDPTKPKGRIMAAIVWVTMRRGEPDLTLRDAASRVRLTAFQVDEDTDEASSVPKADAPTGGDSPDSP